MKVVVVLLAALTAVCGVPVLPEKEEEIPSPPQPYSFAYTAGRYPGHVDRTHQETSDGSGVIRGMFAYVDPRFQVRTVEYVADSQGFHPNLSNPVEDTPTVAAAKAKHYDLYAKIAAEHARIAAERGPGPDEQQLYNNY